MTEPFARDRGRRRTARAARVRVTCCAPPCACVHARSKLHPAAAAPAAARRVLTPRAPQGPRAGPAAGAACPGMQGARSRGGRQAQPSRAAPRGGAALKGLAFSAVGFAAAFFADTGPKRSKGRAPLHARPAAGLYSPGAGAQ